MQRAPHLGNEGIRLCLDIRLCPQFPYKNLKISTVEWLENENYHVYRKLFPGEQHFFKWIPAPENCKNQETNRIKSKKINRTQIMYTSNQKSSKLEGYSRHSRQPSLNISHIQIRSLLIYRK